jgi:RNA polymerase sigma-70 factor (ECF subfamily)
MTGRSSTFALLEKARGGDRESLSALFEKNRRRLGVLIHFKLRGKLRQEAEVEDVLQETYLRAFRDFELFSYRSPGSFLRWLASIAEHVIVDRARYQGRRRRAGEAVRFRSVGNPHGPEPADTTTPSRLFAQQEGLGRLLARLEELPEQYREAILLAKVEGLSTAEMAERLGKPREAVALLLYRALKRFRGVLERGPDEGGAG